MTLYKITANFEHTEHLSVTEEVQLPDEDAAQDWGYDMAIEGGATDEFEVTVEVIT